MPPPPPPPPPLPPHEPAPPYPIPTFTIRIENLAHPGASIFLSSVKPLDALHAAVLASFSWLYGLGEYPTNVKNILLVLRSMPGVAYTTGTRTDKEIHFSLDHVVNSASRATSEINGVLTHEVVHCYQYDAMGTCPSGLIEGVADWVRLRSNLAPPHWKATPGEKWDAGYQSTAYFLEWLETRYGDGSVPELNSYLRKQKWDDVMFKELTGRKIGKLWKLYCQERGDRGPSLGRKLWDTAVTYQQVLKT